MTSCAIDNYCLWGDKVETICPCASIGKLIVTINIELGGIGHLHIWMVR